jgi:hypothetical protein
VTFAKGLQLDQRLFNARFVADGFAGRDAGILPSWRAHPALL